MDVVYRVCVIVQDDGGVPDTWRDPPFHYPCACGEGVGKGRHVGVVFHVIVCCGSELQSFVSGSKYESLD